MRLSEDKISHIAHLMRNCVEKNQLGKIKDVSMALRIAKNVFTKFCQLDDQVDQIVRKKLESYAHRFVEGSRDWEILYKKHFEEEMKKRW